MKDALEMVNEQDLFVYPLEQSSCKAPPETYALFSSNIDELSMIKTLSNDLMAPPFDA